jgi:hypothetical protein
MLSNYDEPELRERGAALMRAEAELRTRTDHRPRVRTLP